MEGVVVVKRNNAFIKTLAVVGTVLVLSPIVAPLVFTNWAALGTGHLNIDWLMPAELGLLAVVGAPLLLGAALASHARRGLVLWGVGIAVAAVVAGTLITTLSGLASGAVEPANTPWWPVAVGMIGLYAASLVELGIAGILMLRDLFRHGAEGAEPGTPAEPTPA